MRTPFKRLLEPHAIKVDFTDQYWNISAAQARWWLSAAVAADLLVQALAGKPSLFTVLASLLTLAIFWAIPARLSGAVGGLYVTQALVSLLIVTVTATLGSKMLVDIAALMWSGWSMFALVRLILAYIRTPKALM